MGSIKLSEGAFEKILTGSKIQKPLMQVLHIKNLSLRNAKKYRFLLSDGKNTYQCCIMFGSLIERVEAGEFVRFTILKLNGYLCINAFGSLKKVIVLTEPEVVVPGLLVGRKIGNPTPYVSNTDLVITENHSTPKFSNLLLFR